MPSVPVDGRAFCLGIGRCDTVDASDQWGVIGRVALAAVLGAIIGLEREYRGYPAGVRTMALVGMGSAIFADMARLDANTRMSAQIVSGVGFLGAGLIFREGLSVRGITTAATIWGVAAIGVATAFEAYIVAVFAAGAAVVLLELRVVTKNIRHVSDEDDNHRHPPDEDDGPPRTRHR